MKNFHCNLTDCFLCRNCISEWKDLIAIKKKNLAFKKGEILFKEGEKVKGIFFVYSGSAKVHKKWAGQKDLIIRFARAGEILGHRGIGAGDIYPVSATALEEVKTCFIDSEFLEATLKTNHALLYTLMQFYAKELQKAEDRLRNLTHMEVKGRIADALFELEEVFGLNEEKFIGLVLTRQDIASYAGTTYETVFKFFTELIHKKIITTRGKGIRINNRAKLKSYLTD